MSSGTDVPRAGQTPLRSSVERSLEALAGLRRRYLYRACDALLTAEHVPASRPFGRAFFWGRMSNYRRVHVLAELLARISPALVRSARRRLVGSQGLPFTDVRPELLSYGAASTVFLLSGQSPNGHRSPMVLKVFRKSIGLRSESALELARELRARYERVRGWYAEASVVPMSHFLILKGPLLGLPAVACVQSYVPEEKWDLLDPELRELVLDLVRRDEALRRQFRSFAERTRELVESRRLCVDLVGRENLLIVRSGGSLQLQLIDHGILDLDRLAAKAPRLASKAGDSLAYLQQLYETTFHRSR